jgi:hypothetical protein
MVQRHHAWTVNECQSADPHLATAVQGRFVGNRGKEPQSDVVKEVGSQESVSCNVCTETQGGRFEHVL